MSFAAAKPLVFRGFNERRTSFRGFQPEKNYQVTALHKKYKNRSLSASEPGAVATGSVVTGVYANENRAIMIPCAEATQSLPLPVLISGPMKRLS